jgi:hypothetical protein
MADKTKDEGPKKMEVGGSGEAKASFKDSEGGRAKVRTASWQSSNAAVVVVSQDDKDPLVAKLVAVNPGPVTVTVNAEGEEGGRASAAVDILVEEKGTVATGEIELAVKPAPVKEKAREAA